MFAITPEQAEEFRPAFETIMKQVHTGSFDIRPDGLGYVHEGLNCMWEGWFQAMNYIKEEAMKGMKSDDYTHMALFDRQRLMRGYSPIFTRAYDLNEPVFVLRAQDSTAHKAIAQWIALNVPRLGPSHPKIVAAKATLGNFLRWSLQKEPD